jgi:mono/diheme cytochrome c family protein/DNA-binding beta-propeller fold protein YncE
MTGSRALLAALFGLFSATAGLSADPEPAAAPAKPSYYKDIRPIFAQHCNGCHQPAKPGGSFVMTSYSDLFKRGEREKAGIVAGKPAASYLLEQVTPHDGEAEMPKGRDPLKPAEIKLITDWIAQGASDDTPASARDVIVDASNPPKYMAPPVIASVAFDPKGVYFAVSGYHEILLYSTKDYKLEGRLIGMSERINSIAFSPDGDKLAAAGGSPGRFGEIQIWNHKTERLTFSAPFTFDTLYGASWSPDGKMVAFGCADNTVRAIDPVSGKQVLQMGTHTDWVLGTVFSQDGLHLASASRDMSMKLTEVATQRFIDNVTSITPGALKGGLTGVDLRPPATGPVAVHVLGFDFEFERGKRMQKVPEDTPGAAPKVYDELLVGGSDGIPRLYKMHRESKRVIGDDANRIREYQKMPGRVYSVAFSPDGKHFAAASSLDGTGEVRVYETESGKWIGCKGVSGPAYDVAWHPNGKTIASAGFDGKVWLHDAGTGKLVKEFTAMPEIATKTGEE